ncbi:MAG: hypothetical protein KJ985_15695, partial [Proteobacteria bacterium]|nr:hypothetical protein [Pseudomonadota bacterium]
TSLRIKGSALEAISSMRASIFSKSSGQNVMDAAKSVGRNPFWSQVRSVCGGRRCFTGPRFGWPFRRRHNISVAK